MKVSLRLYRRTQRFRVGVIVVIFAWSVLDICLTWRALAQHHNAIEGPTALGHEKIFIASIHWNNEGILREVWIEALLNLVDAIGHNNVYVSIQESGSWDGSKDALRHLDNLLAERDVPRQIILDETTHLDEISKKPPTKEGWIQTPLGQVELRRIPYLARLRNFVLRPLYESQRNNRYNKILFLGDVVFNTADIQTLLSTRGGDYAAACSLDFFDPPLFYDTFALRDSQGYEKLMMTWPYFRSRASRSAVKQGRPVPVSSCWNGIVAMDSSPFYASPPLRFRGIPDSMASAHLEASECCLVHTDNPLSNGKGVWLNPDVRVGYSQPAYEKVHPARGSWISTSSILVGIWKNRILRWFTTTWFTEWLVENRLAQWERQFGKSKGNGTLCVVNEMQVLVENGWAHR